MANLNSSYEFQVLQLDLKSKSFRSNLQYSHQELVEGKFLRVFNHPVLGEFYSWDADIKYGPAYSILGLPQFLSKDPRSLYEHTHFLRSYYDTIERIPYISPNVGGIANREPAYPRGGFANAQEYEQYVMLYVNRRDDEIPAYLAGLAGAPAFNARDPFPHGHCYLNLLPRDKQQQHYRRGQDYLTKEKLEQIMNDIKQDKVLCYHIRAATTDAHVDLQKDAPANSVLMTAGHLAKKLKEAFDDAVVDWDEYQEIYYNNPVTHRV